MCTNCVVYERLCTQLVLGAFQIDSKWPHTQQADTVHIFAAKIDNEKCYIILNLIIFIHILIIKQLHQHHHKDHDHGR